ncbi:MAG: hypothetical protein MJ241_05685 [Bacilli bacterium]|nr:hypothetical protein [Bacilli bacterium]
MNNFKDLELFSIQVTQPGKNTDKDSNMVFSVWKSGYYTIRTTSFATVDERPSGYAYKLTKDAYDKFEKLTNEYIHVFEEAPLETHIDGVKSMDYTLSLNGKCYTGNFAFFPSEWFESENFNAKEKKKMKWSNHVIEFYKKIQTLGKELEAENKIAYVSTPVKEIHYLKPSTRSYIASFRKGIGFTAQEAKTKDAIIKRAMREALGDDKIPSGKVFSDLVGVMKEATVDMIRNSATDKDFDVAHGRLCKSILDVLGGSYDYVEASRIVDYFFVFSLLCLEEVHTDEQAMMLHYPVTHELLMNKYENASKIEYTFFQKDMRIPAPNAVIVPALSFLSAMRFDRLSDMIEEKREAAQA